MDQSRYKALKIERTGRVLTIAIDLPDKANAVTHELHEEMARVFDDAADDPDSDVIVLTGAGSVFCAGGDMNWLADELREGLSPFVIEARTMKRIVHSLLDCPKPVIAKVNGDAMGFGATIALLCDVVFAAEGARFADPHVKVGLVAGDGGALIWPQLIGFGKARHYLLTGDAIEASEAERLGLIAFAVAPDALDDAVAKYTDRMARGAQTAIRYTKVTTNIALKQLLTSVFEAGVAYEGLSRHTDDYREGVTAFLEKRRPGFTGR
ncbi:enoyl-CoA hydratase/isomerase family protein [Sphingomonas aliaeris]|uniref:Enoyl-CoA hydratase/isomerase family protein n=1 Tax=Sphingomonas aliaeris TaxID=2759526 RepID=A0A974NVG1_9SPHN|nr:enoyl-CoA hydratase-related protein [Sphingomonas aliaeris]QQV77671.1 enoyl-CoA hydratase/isomerase family protein [Sphingomonas aliaeris]